MDKGAHFYRCDLQVHSPRDINWSGSDAVSDEERMAYADELVLACRTKGLKAIAITDHHDFTFFRYIKEAAEKERDDDGNYYDLNDRLVVFPGIELTFTNPASCQAILILDSCFPPNEFTPILNKLSINPSSDTEKSTAETVPISTDVVNGLDDLHIKLNTIDNLKGKYIVLPNLSIGHGGILRRGFYDHYKRMPCVGGYVDGALPNNDGFLNIINGRDRNYGFKSVAVFQTSDNRRRDHNDLGSATSWVKWAIPSAEALRQACLAKESRISQLEPSLPSIHIISIDVSNSKFMGPIILEYNQQYNALIGGRGTGKSTILEYLRWGLCDQPPEISKKEQPEYQERRRKLIEKTLLPFNATVQIAFIKNGVLHVIKRKSDTHEVFLKIGHGQFEICKEFDVRNLLPIQAYSQKQLSSVGVSCDELKRLVYSPIRQELNEYSAKFKELSSEIRNCYELIQSKKLITKEIAKDDLELKSLDEQLSQLKNGLKGLSEKDQHIITDHVHYEKADEQIKTWQREVVSTKEDIKTLIEQLERSPSLINTEIKLSNIDAKHLAEIESVVKYVFNEISENAKSLEALILEKNEKIILLNDLISRWEQIYKEHITTYENAKKQTTSHEQTLNQIVKIEGRLKELRRNITEKKGIIARKGNPEVKFSSLVESWYCLHNARADVIDEQCSLLESFSNANLRAKLGRGKGTESLERKLKETLQGTKIQKHRIENLCVSVKNSRQSVKSWIDILNELRKLSDLDPSEETIAIVPLTPILSNIGLTESELIRIAGKLTNEDWIDLFLIELEDIPIFEYKTKDSEYIDFEDASAGQQATALIHILLSQEGPPLIIDQPEEDLDNEMVSDIARLIWNSKTRRQLIFASHNANIVVNGDAELVICCRYRIAADQSKGTIDSQGAIDIPEIKDEITRVMEGGEEAFKLRKEKYGF